MRTLKGSDDEELLSEAGKATVDRLILYIKYIQGWIHVEGIVKHFVSCTYRFFSTTFVLLTIKKHDPAKILSCA